LAASISQVDALKRDFHYQAVEPRVGHQQVTSAAQHEEIDAAFRRPSHGLFYFCFGSGLDKPARKATYADGGKRCERLIFNQEHRIKSIAPGLDRPAALTLLGAPETRNAQVTIE
jgi:hypothetical protein